MSKGLSVTLGVAVLALGLAGCNNSAAKRRDPAGAVQAKPAVVELRHQVVPAATTTAQPQVAAVGRQAPDFELPAYHKGKFTTVKLSDHRGKWLLLCFYPGDFTFV